MRIAGTGVLNATSPRSHRAFNTFPSVVTLPDGKLLASYRVGTSKDCDDEQVELRESDSFGLTWSAPRSVFPSYTENGHTFSLKMVYFTLLRDGKILAAGMAVDRTAFPGKPLFNENQGCLPMRILISASSDGGVTWAPWRVVDTPEDIGPPSLTSPMLLLADGRLAMSLESNKHYLDTSQWLQKVIYLYSSDSGQTWGNPVVVARDPTGRIFNWDQRAGVTADGTIVTFTWVYDSADSVYRNIWRRSSPDGGATWTEPEDIGFADQASCPAILPDGRIVLAWVDRFGSQSIRARMAAGIGEPFDATSEVVLYDSQTAVQGNTGLSQTLDEMSRWSYGLPFACALPDGNVLIVYYAGSPQGTSVHWARLSLGSKGLST